MKLFGIIDLSTYSKQSVFVICVAGVFVKNLSRLAQENIKHMETRGYAVRGL